MGTQLYERGVLFSSCYEELNVSRPELVTKVHEDYVRAGAHVLETNTFGANALRLEKYGLQGRVRELNAAGVRLARGAAGQRAYVFGAIGPTGYFLGESGQRNADDLAKARSAFSEQADALLEAGVDALIVETFRQTPELRTAVEAAVAATGGRVPVIASVSLDESGFMAEGTSCEVVARLVKELGASVVGVNCSEGPMAALAAAEKMIPIGLPVLVSPNAGLPRRVDERMVYVATPEYFGVYAMRMARVGVRLLGGCCGTTPEHIRRIADSARMASPTTDRSPSPLVVEADKSARPASIVSNRWNPGGARASASRRAERIRREARARQVRRFRGSQSPDRARSIASRRCGPDAEGWRRGFRQCPGWGPSPVAHG